MRLLFSIVQFLGFLFHIYMISSYSLYYQNFRIACTKKLINFNALQSDSESFDSKRKQDMKIDKDDFRKILEKVKEYDSEWLKKTLGENLIEILENDISETTLIKTNKNDDYDDFERESDNYQNTNQLVQQANNNKEDIKNVESSKSDRNSDIMENQTISSNPVYPSVDVNNDEEVDLNARLLELRYTNEDILHLKPSVKKIIVDRNMKRPSKQLPSIWMKATKSEPSNNNAQQKLDDESNYREFSKNRPTTNQKINFPSSSVSNSKTQTNWKNVSPEKESFKSRGRESSKTKIYDRVDSGEYYRDSTFIEGERGKASNLFWPDKEEFKDLLLEESRWRASLVGEYWLPTIKQEAKWRYYLYKRWKEFLDKGVNYGFESVDMPTFDNRNEEYEEDFGYDSDDAFINNRVSSRNRKSRLQSDVDKQISNNNIDENIELTSESTSTPPSQNLETSRKIPQFIDRRVTNNDSDDYVPSKSQPMRESTPNRKVSATNMSSREEKAFMNNNRAEVRPQSQRQQSPNRQRTRQEIAYDNWLESTLTSTEGWTDMSTEQKLLLKNRKTAKLRETESKRLNAAKMLDKDDWFSDLDYGYTYDDDDSYDDDEEEEVMITNDDDFSMRRNTMSSSRDMNRNRSSKYFDDNDNDNNMQTIKSSSVRSDSQESKNVQRNLISQRPSTYSRSQLQQQSKFQENTEINVSSQLRYPSDITPLKQQRKNVMSVANVDESDDDEDDVRSITTVVEEQIFREMWEASANRKPI